MLNLEYVLSTIKLRQQTIHQWYSASHENLVPPKKVVFFNLLQLPLLQSPSSTNGLRVRTENKFSHQKKL